MLQRGVELHVELPPEDYQLGDEGHTCSPGTQLTRNWEYGTDTGRRTCVAARGHGVVRPTGCPRV